MQRGKMQNLDPHCNERSASDECCVTVLCDNDAEIVDLGKLVNREVVVMKRVVTELPLASASGDYSGSVCTKLIIQCKHIKFC